MKTMNPPLTLHLQHGSLETVPQHYSRRFNGPALSGIRKFIMTPHTSLLWFHSHAARDEAQQQTGWPQGAVESDSLEMLYLANRNTVGHEYGIVPVRYHGPKIAYYVHWRLWVDRLSATLRLRRGRYDYDFDQAVLLKNSEFDGPALTGVINVSWEWGQYHLFFESYPSACKAEIQTGWPLRPHEQGFSLLARLEGQHFICYHLDDLGNRRTAHFSAMELLPFDVTD